MLDMRAENKELFNSDTGFSIPGGPALIYMMRRFGYPNEGSDSDKNLCRYYFPTAIDGLGISFSFGGQSCFIRDATTEEMMQKIHMEYWLPAKRWWDRCREWALSQGNYLYVHSFEDLDLYIAQAEAWLLTQGVPADYEMSEEEFTDEWMGKYQTHCDAHNEKLRDEYKEIDPFPDDDRETEFTLQCKGAIKQVLVDMLRPVTVRDVVINILGEVEFEYDEDGGVIVNEAPHWHAAGNAVPDDLYTDAGLFFDFIDHVRDLGVGNLQEGMKVVMRAPGPREPVAETS